MLIVYPFMKKMVTYLGTLFLEDEKDGGRAKYLTSEVMEIPATALAALRKETIHLYDKSLEAIVHAMNLHRSAIFSDTAINEVVEHSVSPIRIDIDKVYQPELKSLYGEIIKYSSMSQTYMDQEGNNKMYELKLTARNIIEMVKDVRELQKNLNFYTKSHNSVIIEKYNKLRAQLIVVLRKIQQVRAYEGDEEDILTQIEVQRNNAIESEITLNHEVDALIRENKIDPGTASSLINDIGFTHSISKKLLKSAVQNIAPSTIKNSIKALKRNEIVGIFPEGNTTEQYLRPAKNGAAYLAMTAEVPILPIGLTGMDNIWNNWFKGIKPKLQINIGKPFAVGVIPKDRKKRNEAIKYTGDKIMFNIAALVLDRFRGEFSAKRQKNIIKTI